MADIVYNYVKFMRGTPTAFKNLASKNKDTLYFIHEEDAITGQLYIGDILISDNLENDSDVIVAKLSDLEDVNIADVIDKQVLGYDADTGKWIPVTLEQAINVAPMIGATADTDGAEGLVPAPKAGDEGKFLRGDGTWAEALTESSETITIVKEDVSNLKELLGTPASELETATGIYQILDTKANTSDIANLIAVEVAKLDHLKRITVNSIDDIDISAENAEEYIYMVPSNDSEDKNAFEEYMVINGNLERLGTYSIGSVGEENLINAINTSEFVISTDGTKTLSLLEVPATKIVGLENNSTFTVLQTEVGTLTTELTQMNTRVASIEEAIVELQENSSWGSI